MRLLTGSLLLSQSTVLVDVARELRCLHSAFRSVFLPVWRTQQSTPLCPAWLVAGHLPSTLLFLRPYLSPSTSLRSHTIRLSGSSTNSSVRPLPSIATSRHLRRAFLYPPVGEGSLVEVDCGEGGQFHLGREYQVGPS